MYKYAHGADIYDDDGIPRDGLIDFSSSINPLGIRESVLSAAKEAAGASSVYPDSESRLLKSAIAAFEGVPAEDIFVSAGASDIFFRLMAVKRPERVLLTAPSFSDYARAAQAYGAQVSYHALTRGEGFQITREFAEAVTREQPDIVFLCNPNNPTGVLTGLENIRNVLDAASEAGSLLVVDECFLGLAENGAELSAKSFLGEYENLLIVRAFTKTFSLPGLRIGYSITSDTGLNAALRQCGPDWPVSNVAQAAALASLEGGAEFLEETHKFIAEAKRGLIRGLRELGLAVFGSAANFVFFYADTAINLQTALLEKGIAIRDCAGFAGLTDGYYRIAVRSERDNDALLSAIAALMNGGK